MYKALIRPVLYLFDPEKIHYFTTSSLHSILAIPGVKALFNAMFVVKDKRLEREVMGIRFPNPVGLAAGFDKNASMFEDLAHTGFGFIEIGTLTPKGQPGNPKPRLFRLKKDEALINRMGFNNGGVEDAVERLKKRSGKVIIGGNIGKNKVTPNEQATDDYVQAFKALHPYVDYFVVNVSSPNTPNLRELQEKEPLKKLLGTLVTLNKEQAVQRPILLKIAPDMGNEQLNDIVEIVQETGIEGIIATNTTIERKMLTTDPSKVESIGAGGVSGAPVRKRSTEVIRYLREKGGKDMTLIGVGGIFGPEDAKEKLEAGADLVQVYTGFIYEGPALVKRICRGLLS